MHLQRLDDAKPVQTFSASPYTADRFSVFPITRLQSFVLLTASAAMKPSTFVWKTSASLLLYTVLVGAQQTVPAPYQPQPTQAWSPASACTNGLANPSDPNGLYTDVNGAVWAIHCGQTSDGVVFDSAQGVGGQGITACMNGCDNRPGCTAWGYKGSVTGKYMVRQDSGYGADEIPQTLIPAPGNASTRRIGAQRIARMRLGMRPQN